MSRRSRKAGSPAVGRKPAAALANLALTSGLLALAAGAAVAQEAGGNGDGGPEWTRMLRVSGGLDSVLADVLAPVQVYDLEAETARIGRVAEALDLGDHAVFHLDVEADGRFELLELRVVRDFFTYLRIRGRGPAFRTVAREVKARWRASLISIEGPIELALRGGFLAARVASDPPAGVPYGPHLRVRRILDRDGAAARPGLARAGAPGDLAARPDLRTDDQSGAGQGRAGPRSRHALTVRRGSETDRLRLSITDSTSHLLAVAPPSVTVPDTALRHRFPPNSFALLCRESDSAARHCAEIASWTASRPGISIRHFPAGGVAPWPDAVGPDREGRPYFAYRDSSALNPVRGCLEQLGPALRGVRGPRVTVELWTGARLGPDRAGPRDLASGGRRPAGLARCLRTVPPPAADSLSLPPGERARYRRPDYYGRVCGPHDRLRRRHAASDSDAARDRPAREDSVVRVRLPVVTPGDRWAAAAARDTARRPKVLPPNDSRSAADRAGLRSELREWRCIGGDTIGDGDAHPGTAWFWIRDGGDWYFLLPATTAPSVDAYLALIEAHDTDVAWTALPAPDGGPERVAVGPDRTVIPDFLLYRWRP